MRASERGACPRECSVAMKRRTSCSPIESSARPADNEVRRAASCAYAFSVCVARRRSWRRWSRYRSTALGKVRTDRGHEAPQRVAHQLADALQVERAHLGIEALRILGGERHHAEIHAVALELHQRERLEVGRG